MPGGVAPTSDEIAVPEAGGLLDRTVELVHALRRAGLPVSSAETLDAARAMAVIELIDRESLRAALAASVCKRPAYRITFDTLFDLYFPPRLGAAGPDAASAGDGSGQLDDGEPPAAPDRDALRAQLLDLLLDGADDALRRFAREAVAVLGRADAQPGRQSWFSYRVLRTLSPETLMSALLDALLAGQDRGGLAEKVARQIATERIAAFEAMVESEIRRLLAEERGVDAVAKAVVRPMADQVDFLRASRADLVELRRTVAPLAHRLATRLTARRRLGRRGRLDFRRTVRASLATGGVPVETIHRPHKPHKPELVVLCDVSGSVASFAHFTLLLTSALREQFARVRAFAFIDTCDEVTAFFGPAEAGNADNGDLGEAMARMAAKADLVWFDGHSDYGHAFEVFEERWPDAITPKTSLLILGDARNNHRATGAPTLARLAHQARHTYWLNPEPAGYWGSGDSAVRHYEPLVDEMVECRNAAQLAEFVGRLLPG